MSYLDFTRLHFAGEFQADVSTVNNDPYHFNNQAFVPLDQQLPSGGAQNGWWNPGGTAYWRLRNVVVTAACYADGRVATDSSEDPVIGTPIIGADDRVAAKLVDLDSENQLVSEIWGFQVNLGDLAGGNAFRSDYLVSAIDDLWFRRVPSIGGDSAASAYLQSVLQNLEWSEVLNSPILQALKTEADQNDNMLSIRFTIDGYNDTFNTAGFTYGRIVGEIGVYTKEEPKHFVNGRYLRPVLGAPVNLNFTPARVVTKEQQDVLFVDLSNSLPAQSPGGEWVDSGSLRLAVQRTNGSYLLLGAVEYQRPGWYVQAGGIESFSLTKEAAVLVKTRPLAVVQVTNDGAVMPVLQENEIGGLARADYFVYRLDPQEGGPFDASYWPHQVDAEFYALRFGEPAKNEKFWLSYDNTMIGDFVQQISTSPAGPPIGTPQSALKFPESITTDETGKAKIILSCSDPGFPRDYIDGQVYGIGATWADVPAATYQRSINPNPLNLISVRVNSGFQPQVEGNPVWRTDLQPIFQQYANVYPIMGSILDLGDYESVVIHRIAMTKVFSMDVHSPGYMPVTRDLSNGKKAAILTWLKQEPTPFYWLPPITDINQLKRALQSAIELEHATIPLYLAAYFSIKPGKNAEVAELIRSVLVEEMLHTTLVCNMLNAIGGSPSLDHPAFIPTYPGSLPNGLRPGLIVSLKKCSIEHIQDVFMQVEEPEETRGGVKHSLTIAWFYDQISAAFKELNKPDKPELFTGKEDRQIEKWGKKEIGVHDLDSAQRAINTIKDQGEGVSPVNPLDKLDATKEPAHYYKFGEIVNGRHIVVNTTTNSYSYTGARIPFDPDGVYNMVDDPNTNHLAEGTFIREKSQHFDRAYTHMLQMLHKVFNGNPDDLSGAITMMFSLTTLAHQLLLLPINEGSDEVVGPSFLYRP